MFILLFVQYSPKNQLCKWKTEYINTFDKKRSKIVKEYLKLLSILNIKYFLGFGSELGAVRNGGLIVNDHDLDIIIPIWMNYRIFRCKEYIDYFPQKCYIYSHRSVRVCNKTKQDFMMILKDYIENRTNKNIYYRCRDWGMFGYTSCWALRKHNIFIDFWILIGKEYFYQNFETCYCSFSNYISYCTNSSKENVKKMYGKKWKIPNKQGCGASACYTIAAPNKINSNLKRISI